MNANIEPTAGVLRVYRDGKHYGDRYEWAASVRWLDRHSIEIMGCDTKVTVEIWRAITTHCQRIGIERILIVRYVDYEKVDHWVNIPSKPKDELCHPPTPN